MVPKFQGLRKQLKKYTVKKKTSKELKILHRKHSLNAKERSKGGLERQKRQKENITIWKSG